ncbi:hypothetical protein METP3_00364 [Methanosarcinales archaeon]|nr:hypothetical protein METP3_00364 [Methanosarcinales archaeon]
MIRNKPPKIDPRRFEDIEGMIKGLVPHYTPEWEAASDNDPGVALIKVFTHMSESIINHFNQAPQKNFIAFLDMLGIKQLPAQSSRVPATFVLAKGMDKEILIPERTQVSADKTEEHDELLFETEKNLMASPGQLIDVYGIDPVNDRIYKPPQDFLDIGKETQENMVYTIVSLASNGTNAFQLDHITKLKEKDILKIADTGKIEYVEISALSATIVNTRDKLGFDHSPATKVEKITKFNLFEGKNLQEHILYLAHKELFNIKGKAQFNLYVTHHQGTETGVLALQYIWQYWGKIKTNGEEVEDWQEFDIIDGTHGLTMEGEINLIKPDEGEITEKEIKLAEGEEDESVIKSRWIRCKLKEQLGNKVVRKLPKLDNIVFTVESRGKDLVPDLAFNNDIPLDISKPFMPFGKEPRIFDIFAIGANEAFSKKGATIKMNIKLYPEGSLGPPTAILFDEYLFRWNEIYNEDSSQDTSGNDNQRIRAILIQKYRIDWVKKAKINKTIQNTIKIFDEKNSILIKLNDEQTKAILTIDDGRTNEFIVKMEYEEPVIFDRKIRVFLRGFFGRFIEIKTDPEDPAIISEWIDHGFPPNTTIFARSAPSAVVYHPLNSSTDFQERDKLLSIFLRGKNGHLIERLFDTKKIKWEWIDWQSPWQYLFNWDKIPGSDNLNLIKYLKLNFGFDPAKIKKIENIDDCTKKIYAGINSILLTFYIEKSKVVLKFDDGRTDEFNAKMENGQLNIYSQKNNVDINSDPAAIYDTELSVFVIASDNYLYEFNKKKGEWKCHPHENNQTFGSSPFVVIDKSVHIGLAEITDVPRATDVVRIFLKGQNGQLFQLKCKLGDDATDDSWIAVESLPSGFKADSKPFAWISDDATNILIYIKGNDNQLWEYNNIADDPKWKLRKHPSVTFDSDPHGFIHIDSSLERLSSILQPDIHIFLRGVDNSLYEYNNINDWNTNHQMPVKLNNSPFVLNEIINNKLFIFLDTSQNRILERIIPYSQTEIQNSSSWIEHKDPDEQILTPSLSWEYLTDTGWTVLKKIKDETSNLLKEGKIELKVPDDIVKSKIAGKENYWIRARLIGGNYGEEIFIPDKNTASSNDAASTQLLNFTKTNIKPPIFEKITIEYSFEEKKEPEKCIIYNNLKYLDQTQASKIPDKFFEPFVQLDEEFPGIYLGFDKILKGGPLRIFFAVKELNFIEDKKPIMKWSYSKGTGWNELEGYSDNTEGLIKSDILEFAGPTDFSGRSISAKFLFWIKGSLTRGKYEEYPLLSGIYPNTTFAVQAETIREEILGSSDGRPGQIFSFLRVPVLEGEEIRAKEILTDQEKKDLIDKFEKEKKPDRMKVEPIFEVKDETGRTIETWVLWSEVQNFFDSNNKDRHYTIDRATGKIGFGNGANGMIPSMGENNVKAFSYQTGGGAEGNIKELEIKSLKSAVSGIDKVLNPEAADGGAIVATLDQMLEIGPAMISHRNRAVTAEDFEWLAKKASRKIAKVKCLSNTSNQTNTNNVHLKKKGWITVIIVPDENIPDPVPSLELKRKVRSYLEEHCANTVSSPGHIWVDGPTYIDISVSVDVFVTSIDLISMVEREVNRKLDEFFHPLSGGPDGTGWDFGRDVNVSDIYALLGEIDGVDHIENLILDYDVPDKEFLFSWNEIIEDNSRLVDYLINNYDANWIRTANIINSDELKANLFSWDEFLEKDSRLMDFLIQNFNEDWIKVAKIEYFNEYWVKVAKIDIHPKNAEKIMMIKISDGKNCLSLKLNHKETMMKVIINDIKTEEFSVNKENSRLIIKTRTIKISDGENSLFLKLNNDETKVNLIINNGRIDEFIVKNENGRLNIYNQDVIEMRPDFLVGNGKHTINTQFSKGE